MGQNGTWQHVQETIDAARSEITTAVKAMITKINLEKQDALNKLCQKYNCKMWFILEEDGTNPFMIRPLIYIWFIDHDSLHGDVMDKWYPLARELDWASDLRITIKLIEKPFEGEPLFSYPQV